MMTMVWDSDHNDFRCQLCGGSCEPGLDNRWRCTNCGRTESTDSAVARGERGGAGLAGTGTSAGSVGSADLSHEDDRVSPLGGQVEQRAEQSSAAASGPRREPSNPELEWSPTESERVRVDRQQTVLHRLYYAEVSLTPGGFKDKLLLDRAIIEALIYLVQNTPPLNSAGIRMT